MCDRWCTRTATAAPAARHTGHTDDRTGDLEVFGLAHVFQPGHRLQVSVTTPPLVDGLWGYEPSRAPGLNTVHRGGEQASRVVVPLEPWSAVEGDKRIPTGDPCEYAGYRCLADGSAALSDPTSLDARVDELR